MPGALFSVAPHLLFPSIQLLLRNSPRIDDVNHGLELRNVLGVRDELEDFDTLNALGVIQLVVLRHVPAAHVVGDVFLCWSLGHR